MADKAAVLLLSLLAASRAAAFDASKLEFSRPVQNVTAPGLYHAEVDPALYRHSKKARLGDVRIVGPDGKEVPWLVRPVPPSPRPETHAATVVDAVQLPDGSARAVLDLGAPGLEHDRVTLAIEGAADWFRRTRVEASTDGARFAPLAEGAYVFRLRADGGVSSATTLHYPASTARYLRVTLLPAAGPPVAITGATAAYVPPEAHVPLRLLPSLKLQPLPESGSEQASAWVVDLGAPGVPIAELALTIDDTAFARRARLAASNDNRAWTDVSAALLYRVAPAIAGRQAEENVRLAGGGARSRYFRVVIVNGADEPLQVREVSPGYVAEELVFRAATGGSYQLYVGGDLPAPTYALAGELARTGQQPTLGASLGTITPNETFGHLAKPAAPPPSARRGHELPLAVGLAALLAALALWLLRRMRRHARP
jgi:uncharacterized protein DUF3999